MSLLKHQYINTNTMLVLMDRRPTMQRQCVHVILLR